jgi:hypothetical protein
VPGGLSYQTLDYLCRKVVNLGFNLIRLPYSVQAVQSNPRIDKGSASQPMMSKLRMIQ